MGHLCLRLSRWSDRVHGRSGEPFWLWVEDPEHADALYHHEHFMVMKRNVVKREPIELVFTIPIRDPMPPQYIVRCISDRWLGSEFVEPISFLKLILPEVHPPHTELLDLTPLPKTVLNAPEFEALYKFTHFNPIQTQLFHVLYHTDNNVLLGAPTGSGKTIVAEVAMFRVFKKYPGAKASSFDPQQ
jgi:activating signal cointegrator complex subunit 3